MKYSSAILKAQVLQISKGLAGLETSAHFISIRLRMATFSGVFAMSLEQEDLDLLPPPPTSLTEPPPSSSYNIMVISLLANAPNKEVGCIIQKRHNNIIMKYRICWSIHVSNCNIFPDLALYNLYCTFF